MVQHEMEKTRLLYYPLCIKDRSLDQTNSWWFVRLESIQPFEENLFTKAIQAGRPSVYQPASPTLRLPNQRPVRLSDHPPIRPSIRPSVRSTIRLSARHMNSRIFVFS